MGTVAIEKQTVAQVKSAVPEPVLRSMLDHRTRVVEINVDQYHRMLETGVLKNGTPVELLHGMLVWKNRARAGEDPMTIGTPHSAGCANLVDLTPALKVFSCHIRIQQPVTLPPSHEPEPDGAIVMGMKKNFHDHHPGPAEISCVIEVSDSSLAEDRADKLQAYAQALIPQYVIVNLIDKQIEVYEQPVPAESRYATSIILKSGQSVRLSAGNAVLEVPADELLP